MQELNIKQHFVLGLRWKVWKIAWVFRVQRLSIAWLLDRQQWRKPDICITSVYDFNRNLSMDNIHVLLEKHSEE